MRFTPAITARLADEQSERVRRNHEQRLGEFAALPIASTRVIRDVVLPPNAPPVFVSHGLGRAPIFVGISAIRWVDGSAITAGSVLDYGASVAGAPIDRTKTIVLLNIGFGVPITVDVEVY